jgi:alpha-amylase
VLNHKAGADFKEKFQVHKVDSDDRTKDISDLYDIEGWTGEAFFVGPGTARHTR